MISGSEGIQIECRWEAEIIGKCASIAVEGVFGANAVGEAMKRLEKIDPGDFPVQLSELVELQTLPDPDQTTRDVLSAGYRNAVSDKQSRMVINSLRQQSAPWAA